MSRTSAPAAPGALELPLTVVFRSDWGVGTGTGIAGGVDSVVEKDADARPVVRGTVLTGVVREQAATVARALDEAPRGAWHDFVTALFGTPESPRLVSFTDATVPDDAPDVAVHEVVSLSIDEDTGTAKNDFLRLFERAGACTLRGGVGLARTDLHGRSISWDDGQREAAELVLTLAGLLASAPTVPTATGCATSSSASGPMPPALGHGAASGWRSGPAPRRPPRRRPAPSPPRCSSAGPRRRAGTAVS